jgi:dTDP-glucose 4,6-dehydratase
MTQPAVILVPGGAGFIGSNFVRHALQHSAAHIVVLDKLTYAGSRINLPADARLRFVEGDIADASLVRELMRAERPDWVVNFAAESHVDRSIDDPAAFLHTNVVGTFTLLEAARAHVAQNAAPPGFRLLHVSTDEVFGSLPGSGKFNERTPYAPRSPYSASKAAADHFAGAYFETYGVPVIVTNCSNNYGPYQYPEKLIPLMLLNALEAQPLPIYGDGQNIRDWLYVEDHCDGLWQILQRGRVGEKYNLGGNHELSNLQLVDQLCAVLEELLPARDNAAMRGRALERYTDLKTFVADRPGHDRRYAVDASKVQAELGWQPRHDFASGLRRTVQWYLAHRDWCTAMLHGRYDRQRLGLGTR